MRSSSSRSSAPRARGGCAKCRCASAGGAPVALRNMLMCIGGVAMLVITNPKLALFVLAVVPFVVAPIILFGRKVRALSREAQARMADMVSEGGETLDAARTGQAL